MCPAPPHRSRAPGTWTAAVLMALAVAAAGCGASWQAERGREQLALGRYDAAIARFERAVASSRGDPVVAARYRDELQAARVTAAHHHVELGDKALEARDLAATGEAYRRARTYAPSDPLVVGKLSALLKLRLRIETGIEEGLRTVATLLPRRDDAANLPRWTELLRTAQGLQVWKKDYPRVVELKDKVLPPAALALLADARRLAALEMFDEASVQVQRSLALAPDNKDALALQSELRRRGDADRLARKGDEALAAEQLEPAIAHYRAALAADPRCHAARTGLREARRQFVVQRLAVAREKLAAKQEGAALAAVQAARRVGTDVKKEAAALRKVSGRLFGRAASEAYKRGRRHEKKRRHGAALVAYRTARALDGKQKDLARRLAAMEKIVARGARYDLALARVGIPSGSHEPAGDLLGEGLLARLRAANLGARGVRLLIGRKAARKADGTLSLVVERLELRRSDRQVTRRKKYLDRVEYTPNSKWDIAQQIQSAALADLNARTDVLRPLQQRVDALETRLEMLQGKQVALRRKISEENARHYADPKRKNPCPPPTPGCPQSWAARRWSKHTAYYAAQIDKANSEMQELSPAFSTAREQVAAAQAAFDEAETRARETPRKLRQEIWLDHVYEVTAHQLAVEATVTVVWRDRASGKELLHRDASYHDLLVDFSTPGVVVRKQTLEPPRRGKLPADEAIAAKVVAALLDELAPAAVEQLNHHGQRFVVRIGEARSRAGRVDALARALATGPALPDAVRAALTAQLLEATGLDWRTGEVDVARLPSTRASR